MRVNRDSLLVDAQPPAAPAQAGLKAPFQQMHHQDDEAADEFALFGLAQLSTSSAICSISAWLSFPARSSAACSLAQA